MQETDAVSCLLCLQPDEYGAMIKVCVPRNSIPPAAEKVICRRCAAAIAEASDDGLVDLAQQTMEWDKAAAEGEGRGGEGGEKPGDSADYVSDDKLPDRES